MSNVNQRDVETFLALFDGLKKQMALVEAAAKKLNLDVNQKSEQPPSVDQNEETPSLEWKPVHEEEFMHSHDNRYQIRWRAEPSDDNPYIVAEELRRMDNRSVYSAWRLNRTYHDDKENLWECIHGSGLEDDMLHSAQVYYLVRRSNRIASEKSAA